MRIKKSLLMTALLTGLISCAGPQVRDTYQMPYDDRLKLASIYMQGGLEDKAIPLLEKAVQQDEDRPEAWAMLGELFWIKGDLKASSRNLERALEAGGEDPVTLNNLAWVESERGSLKRALALADRAIAQEPAPLYPYLETRARILFHLKRYSEAAVDARTALSLIPEYDKEMREKLEVLMGDIEKIGAGESIR